MCYRHKKCLTKEKAMMTMPMILQASSIIFCFLFFRLRRFPSVKNMGTTSHISSPIMIPIIIVQFI